MIYLEYLPLIVLLVVFYWQYRKYSRRSLANSVDGIPVGVGGWLFVLVCVMLVANPLNSFVVIQEVLEKLYSDNGGAYNGAWFTIAIVFFTEMVSIVGGWGLAKGNTPNVVTRAKIALWVQAIVGALILPIGMDGGIALFRSLIVATVWTLYLSKSKRVKATYSIENASPITKEMSPIPVATQGPLATVVTPKTAIAFRFLKFAWGGTSLARLVIFVSIALVFVIGVSLLLESYKPVWHAEPSEQAKLDEAVRKIIDEDAHSFSAMLKKATEGDSNAQYALGLMYWKGESVPKDYTKAVEWWQKAAEHGNADAQFRLGSMYAFGDSVPKDFVKAVEWWQLAAEKGNARAQFILGLAYARGKDLPQNFIKAADLLQKAAEQGHDDAQYFLGSMYVNGEGVPKDFAKAVEWWQKAAVQGNAKAQYFLGNLYANGDGVPKDDAKAVEWYRKAAAQGYAPAQSNLGFTYANGLGVSKDYIHAYAWTSLAAAQGDVNGQQNQKRIEQFLTPEQRAEGQRLASHWIKGDTLDGNSSVAASGSGVPRKISTGTAFIISKSGHAITNQHVIHDCNEIKIAGRNGEVKMVTSDSVNDLALLQLSGEVNEVASLSQNIGKLRQGEDIVVFGYPLNTVLSSGGNLTLGTVSALTGLGNNTNQIQITAPIQPGSSGSPVMDKKGNVVGVVSMKLSDSVMAKATGQIGQNVNFAVNEQTVKAFLDANKVPYKTGGGFFSREKSNADIAEDASKWTLLVECWK